MLYSYKMTHDSGFAPNPFYGYLTLANCKPQIRLKKDPYNPKYENLYIAGFTSNELCGDKKGQERLVYLMKVTERLTYEEYFVDPRFQIKKPKPNTHSAIEKAGDNIYEPISGSPGIFSQLPNQNHGCGHTEYDTNGRYVLVSNHFYYFGSNPICVRHLHKHINIPEVQAAHGVYTSNDGLLQLLMYLEAINYQLNLAISPPHQWPANEPYN